ncbi:hypothetical protein D3C72_2547050 [compost metagenome]
MTNKGEYGAKGEPYTLAITRDNLVAKLQALYRAGIAFDPKKAHPATNDSSNINWDKPPLD